MRRIHMTYRDGEPSFHLVSFMVLGHPQQQMQKIHKHVYTYSKDRRFLFFFVVFQFTRLQIYTYMSVQTVCLLQIYFVVFGVTSVWISLSQIKPNHQELEMEKANLKKTGATP